MDDLFKQQWNEAVGNFIIKQSLFDTPRAYIHAEASTGSKYELTAVLIPAKWRDSEKDTMFVTVVNPWERAWTVGAGDWLFPDYVREHWGQPNRSRSEQHGGDLAAVVMCMNILMGHSLDEVRVQCKEWGR